MLGSKIALTGLVFFLIATWLMVAIGKKAPSMVVAVPLLLMWAGGIVAIVAGLLVSIWA